MLVTPLAQNRVGREGLIPSLSSHTTILAFPVVEGGQYAPEWVLNITGILSGLAYAYEWHVSILGFSSYGFCRI
jgi:hypothetical protein